MDDSLWYKNAILYELHVRAFFDGNGDGIGDFKGLRQKLGYLQDLGVNALWLLPFYSSPLKDDGYDIADYRNIHPSYGTLADFKAFLREAHRRGLRVITELVVNHTSDQHPWFQKARRAKPGSPARDFYVWSETPDRYRDARIIFKDFEKSNWTWDPVAKQYYWHRFYSHQPDLNYDNPEVRRAVLDVADFWLEMGVDGMRLDAVPYLVEREGTSCENLAESHAFLKELRRHVDGRFKNRMLLAEANQWPEEASAYFGQGDECHMAFHFPVMPRLFMGIRLEDRFPIVDILQQTPAIPDSCQWALFLRNHDELTLEMVTDEDRDYMWRVYASDPEARLNLGIRHRLAPLLGNNRRKIELMNGLLFSLPGSPVLYYGDEIGMGDNFRLADRGGVRTPMQWSSGRNAGFSEAPARRLVLPVITDPEYHYETLNTAVQEKNPHSLLWQMRRMIALRKQHPAFGSGSMELLQPNNAKVLAFLRRTNEETVLVVANLSRFVQFAQLDLASFRGKVPVEMFGATRFPPIGEQPYLLTLGPHTFFWFTLESEKTEAPAAAEGRPLLPLLEIRSDWQELIHGADQAVLEGILPGYLKTCRWFGGKARSIRSVRVTETIRMVWNSSETFFSLVEVQYVEGEAETYLLPLTFLPAAALTAEQTASVPPGALARIRRVGREGKEEGFLCDALIRPDFCATLLKAISRGRHFRGQKGEMAAVSAGLLKLPDRYPAESLKPVLLGVEQTNSAVRYGEEWFLKMLRRVERGPHPDLEVGRFLGEKTSFQNFPEIAGWLEHRRAGSAEPTVLAILQRYIPNEGDAWSYTLDVVSRYFEEALAAGPEAVPLAAPVLPLMELASQEVPSDAQQRIGPFLELAKLLGKRTAELHAALASRPDDPVFAPEPFTEFYQRSIYQAIRSSVGQVFPLLRSRMEGLPEAVRPDAQKLLQSEPVVLNLCQEVMRGRIPGMRIRCHGDYHLGQVLYTGKDFVIIDFEGEPARALSERRIKRSCLRDVAAMIRSFHYAAYAVLLERDAGSPVRPEDVARLEQWAHGWWSWVSAAFLKSYLENPQVGTLLPAATGQRNVLLQAFLLEKVLYELRYEMNNRPDWVRIPLKGILSLLEKTV